jgi:hypothetical protein
MNKCFYSCQQTQAKRYDEFERLLSKAALERCPISTFKRTSEQVNVNNVTTYSEINSEETKNTRQSSSAYEDEDFVSAGLWLTTVIILALGSIFALLSGFFSMINILCNPIQHLMGTYGLYLWNGLAAILCSLTMIIWTFLYRICIRKNIAIADTLSTHHDDTSARDPTSLGISFWILVVPIFCHVINIGLLYYRNYLLQHYKAPVIRLNKNDSTILVY